MLFELDSVELNLNGRKLLYGIYLKAETGKIPGLQRERKIKCIADFLRKYEIG